MAGKESVDYPPPRRRGASLHVTLIIALALITALAAWLATNEPIGLRFIVYILLAGVAFLPLPILAYRLYSLQKGSYRLDREKLTLTWGLRSEQIPISDIEWVRPLASLAERLPLPWFRLPGSVLGHRNSDLGPVEFIASEVPALLLVATRRQVFAISPADPTSFMQNLQNAMEMGSLSPTQAESVYPSFVLAEAWRNPAARFSWLAGLFLNIGLLAWVSLITSTLGPISMGFQASGEPRETVPGVTLLLLPLISLFLFALGWVLGLAFYRKVNQRPLSQILWASGVVTSILFLLAVLFILSSS